MPFQLTNIEDFFLTNVLRISMGGVLLILITDSIFYPEDQLSIIIDCIILLGCLLAYVIRHKYNLLSKLILISFVAVAMFYQCLAVPVNTSTSLSILLVVGFIISTLLKDKIMWIAHSIIFIALNTIFVIQFNDPNYGIAKEKNDVITIALTYSILYFILTFATAMLKSGYDKMLEYLNLANKNLQEKANEIETQNEELLQMQESLSRSNGVLEKTVMERTQLLEDKTEKLIRYSYVNAHHLRGPVARLLGLVALHKLEQNPDDNFFFDKVKEQANEIDLIIKQINTDLEEI